MSEEINYDRRRFLGNAAMTIAATQVGLFGFAVQQMACATGQLPIEVSCLRSAA